MLAGLPVIAPAFAEEVAAVVREADCGVLVDSADPGAIAAAIATLREPDRRAALGEAGRHAATGRVSWAGEAVRLVELYSALAPQNRTPCAVDTDAPEGQPGSLRTRDRTGERTTRTPLARSGSDGPAPIPS